MSLINDALKKAQKQRTGEAPPLASMPSVGGESAHRIAKRAKPAGFNTLLARAGIGAGVLVVLLIGGYFVLRSPPADKPGVAGPLPESPAKPALPPVATAPATTNAVTPASFTLPVATKIEAPVAKAEAPAPVVTAPAPSTPPVRQASTPTPEAKPSTAAALPPAAKLEPRAIQFIENIKVAGIMARASDAKVLMNDRVYRVGSLVDAELGLKLVEITANSLTFEDDRGGRYTRTF
jgi:hypothetical protein